MFVSTVEMQAVKAATQSDSVQFVHKFPPKFRNNPLLDEVDE